MGTFKNLVIEIEEEAVNAIVADIRNTSKYYDFSFDYDDILEWFYDETDEDKDIVFDWIVEQLRDDMDIIGEVFEDLQEYALFEEIYNYNIDFLFDIARELIRDL